MSEEDKPEKRTQFPTKLVTILLFVLALGHIIAPTRLNLDWPTVAVLIIAIVLGSVNHVSAIIPYLKRFKFGDFEFELRRLERNVEKAEEEPKPTTLPTPKPTTSEPEKVAEPNATRIQEAPVRPSKDAAYLQWVQERLGGFRPHDFDTFVWRIAVEDKRMAVTYVAVEIERVLREIEAFLELTKPDWKPINAVVTELHRTGVLSDPLVEGIRQYFDIRNQMVHTHFFQTNEEMGRVLESGVRLMRQLIELHSTVATMMK